MSVTACNKSIVNSSPMAIAQKFAKKLQQANSPIKEELYNIDQPALPTKLHPSPISPMKLAEKFEQEQCNTPIRDVMYDTVKRSVSRKRTTSPPLSLSTAWKLALRLDNAITHTPLRDEIFHTIKWSVCNKSLY